MDFRNWNGKKKVLAILGGLFVIVGLAVTVFLVNRVQDLRGRAEKATTISLNPSSQEVSPGENATLDVVLNPGVNQVNFVKLHIKYDSSVFSLDGDNYFELDPESGFRLSKPIEIPTPGEMIITVDVGSDPTKVIRTTQRIGTITLPVNSDFEGGVEKDVVIDTDKTQVRSIQSNDAFNENVLANVENAKIIITGGVCVPNTGICSWDAADKATKYKYKISEFNRTESEGIVVEEGEVDSETTQVEFPTKPGLTYKCEVVAKNECGESAPSEGESTCEIPSVTPTPSIIETGTPTPTKTGTPTPSKTGTPTPSKTSTPTPTIPEEEEPTNTPTPTNKPTSTPTPTTPRVATNTPVPTTPQGGISTPTPTPVEIAVSTPIPTLPPTGNPVVITGLVGGFLFLLGGLVLLFL